MKLVTILDATVGRILLPLRTVVSAVIGEFWLDAKKLYVRGNNAPTPTLLRIITDDDAGIPGGFAPLDSGSLIPTEYLPPIYSTGGSGGDSGAGASTGGNPIGTVIEWAGGIENAPSGYLPCDGDEYFQVDYPAAFQVLKHRWGVPSNYASKFRVPNLIGRSIIGASSPADSLAGKLHKIVIRDPGVGFTPSTTISTTVTPTGTATVGSAMTVSIKTTAAGGVESVTVTAGGAGAGVSYATPTLNSLGESNCNLVINPAAGLGASFKYDIHIATTTITNLPWGVQMTANGVTYASIPSVTITGPSLVGVTAIAVLSAGKIREVIVTNPGTGSPASAIVTFSGGGFATPATAVVITWDSPAVIGDLGGEQQHIQTVAELVNHNHPVPAPYQYSIVTASGSGSGSGSAGRSYSDGPFTGETYPTQNRHPYVAMLMLVRME